MKEATWTERNMLQRLFKWVHNKILRWHSLSKLDFCNLLCTQIVQIVSRSLG